MDIHTGSSSMRNFILRVTGYLSLVLFVSMLGDYASAEVSGDWTYTVTDNQATITNYSGSATEIAVPTALEGITVVKLGEDWPPVFYKNDNRK